MYKIVYKKRLNDFVTMMDIEAPLVARKAEPGQFIILRVDADGERIPLTIAGFDREQGTVRIIFQVVGSTTAKLHHKNTGGYLSDFVGPLGTPTHTEGLKKICIVGGGVGCAIALPVAQKLHVMGCEVHGIIGFRSKELLILEDEFRACCDPGGGGIRSGLCHRPPDYDEICCCHYKALRCKNHRIYESDYDRRHRYVRRVPSYGRGGNQICLCRWPGF